MKNEVIEKLKIARQTVCCVYGVSYPTILKIQKELKKLVVDSNICSGHLKIYANAQDSRVVSVCKKYKATPEAGLYYKIEEMMLKE
jgi:hypothetical protein